MSLVQTRWVAIAGAGALAIAMPMKLLGGPMPKVPVPPPVVPTPLPPADPGTLAYAVTAPPFDPDRSPEPAAPAEAEAPPQAQPAAPLPKLVGLVTGGRGRAVALVRSASGETLTLAPGEEADGWRLVSAGRERAVFEQGGTRQTATLDFDNETQAASTAPPATPPPSNPPPGPAPAAPKN